MWKETRSNVVWFSEIVDRHPCCFLWMLYNQISEQVKVKDGLFWVFFYCSHILQEFLFQAVPCPRALQPRCRPWQFARVGMSSLFSLTRWRASEAGRGMKKCVKGSRSQNHTGGGVMWGFFFPHEARILSSFVSLCAIFDVWHGNEWPTSSHLRILWLIDGSLGNLQHDRQTKSPLFCARVTKKCSSQTRKSSQTWPLICSYNIIFSIITTLNNKGSSGLLWSQCRPLCFRCGDLDNCDGNYNKWPLYFKVQRPSLSKSIWVTINLIMP